MRAIGVEPMRCSFFFRLGVRLLTPAGCVFVPTLERIGKHRKFAWDAHRGPYDDGARRALDYAGRAPRVPTPSAFHVIGN